MKKSVVSGIRENTSTYEGKYGTMYVHEISFENKETYEHHTKTPKCTQFIAGQEIEYEVYMAGKSERVRPVKEPFQQSGGGFKSGGKQKNDRNTQILIVYQNALTNAVNYHGGVDKASKVTITETAEYFAEFVLKNKYLSKDA